MARKSHQIQAGSAGSSDRSRHRARSDQKQFQGLYVVGHRYNSPDGIPTDENYIRIPPALRDRHVYRIFSVSRLIELFTLRHNVLVKPHMWDDPFENFMIHCPFEFLGGQTYRSGHRDAMYGQCWTWQHSSDAMWRIYSPKRNAVCIRSTPRRLCESLAKTRGKRAYCEAYIGAVQYLTQARLIKFARESYYKSRSDAIRRMAETLLFKRRAFAHEREVRLIYMAAAGNARSLPDLHPYGIDPHELVDKIIIDPRATEAQARRLRSKIISETQFAGEITRSQLYATPPQPLVRFIPLRPKKITLPPGLVAMVPTSKKGGASNSLPAVPFIPLLSALKKRGRKHSYRG
jgi:hypothetical protein